MAERDDFEAFSKRYDAGESQIVWRRVVADLDTPVSTYLKLAEGRINSFLLSLSKKARPRAGTQ